MSGDQELAAAEERRLQEDASRARNWKRWGPYLSERQWGTVREDTSLDGDPWLSFPHDQARSRAYRWGEDGLLGISDRQCRVAVALALWNERDPILKERLFGLDGHEGNHGEDVKELYYYLDATPTASYLKGLYKYPQAEFPYAELIAEGRRRDRSDPEHELVDTGVFADGRYFDVLAEYAKASPDDILLRVTVTNRGPEPARLHVLPTVWFRNTWSWGGGYESDWGRPRLAADGDRAIALEHSTLGRYRVDVEPGPGGTAELLFTEKETNAERLLGAPNASSQVKDAFHAHVVEGRAGAVSPERSGTKAAAHHLLELAPGESAVLRLRLRPEDEAGAGAFGDGFEQVFADRIAEADAFYAAGALRTLEGEVAAVARQAYAGLVWSKQFYYYAVRDWQQGDDSEAPVRRDRARNLDWPHLFNRDVISMPDAWEYPWYAAWDLAFHMLPFARVDADFAKEQIVLLLREWYMHPNGQIPAYEWAFSDVNPPVHAWAAWRVYKMSATRDERDREFLARVFQKLLVNFTWWVNRKDVDGRHLFAGGFLGLDNIGVFNRSEPLPTGGRLEQADGTAWMAFYAATMLSIALELAVHDPAYEDIASKFFEHFVWIVDAMNSLGGSGLWDEEDGFYYDQLHVDGQGLPLKVRSLVGIIPLLAVEVLDDASLDRLPAFRSRMQWHLDQRPDLDHYIAKTQRGAGSRLLAVPSREQLVRALRYVLDEAEFLSPHGICSLSRHHQHTPYVFHVGDEEYRVDYEPAESRSGLFGGNSNWRGPVWFPINLLLIEALERYHHFYGDELRVEFPTGSGRLLTLAEVAGDLSRRLASLFLPGPDGSRPAHGDDRRYADDPHFRDLALFYEYFDADTGRGLGASHQTGWTAAVVMFLENAARDPG